MPNFNNRMGRGFGGNRGGYGPFSGSNYSNSTPANIGANGGPTGDFWAWAQSLPGYDPSDPSAMFRSNWSGGGGVAGTGPAPPPTQPSTYPGVMGPDSGVNFSNSVPATIGGYGLEGNGYSNAIPAGIDYGLGLDGTGYTNSTPAGIDYGTTGTTGGTTGSTGPLTAAQLAEYRNWINSQGYGQGVTDVTTGQQVAPTGGFNFDNGDFMNFLRFDGATGGNTGGAAADVLGAAIAAGVSDPASLSQITGIPAQDIQPYLDSFSPQALNHLSTQGALNLGYITPDQYQNFNRENTVYTDAPDYGAVGYTGGFGGSLFLDPSWQSSFDNPATGGDTSGGGAGGVNGRGPNGTGIVGRRNMRGGGGPGPGPVTPTTGGTTYTPPAGYQPPPGVPGLPQLNTSYNPSPYLMGQIGQVGDAISEQFNTQILPGIRSNSIMTGGFGGSNQGLAEGRAAGDAAEAFNNASMNLLGQDYTGQMNRNLSQYQGDQGYGVNLGNLALGNLNSGRQYELGQGQLDLGNLNSMLNFYSDQRSQDRADLGMGASLYGTGTNGMWGPLNSANNIFGNYTGFGNTTSNTSSGGGWGGLAGGLLAGGALANNFGWWK